MSKGKRGRPRKNKVEEVQQIVESVQAVAEDPGMPGEEIEVKGDNFCASEVQPVSEPKNLYGTFKCYMNHITQTKEPMEFAKCNICGAKAMPLIRKPSDRCLCGDQFCRHTGKIKKGKLVLETVCLDCGIIDYGPKGKVAKCEAFRAVE